MRVLRSIAVAMVALFGIGIFAAQANASVRVTLSGAPAGAALEAGTHPDLSLRMDFPDWASEDVRNVDVDLPAGMIGNPAATDLCEQDEAEAGECLPETQIGVVKAFARVTIPGADIVPGLNLGDILGEQVIDGKLFNVRPSGTAPAAIAARLKSNLDIPAEGPLALLCPTGVLKTDPINTIAEWRLRSPGIGAGEYKGDYGLTNELRRLPNFTVLQICGNPVIARVQLKAFEYKFYGTGVPGSSTPYKTPYTINPTVCKELKFKARAEGLGSRPNPDLSNAAPYKFGADGELPFTPTKCDKVPFEATQTVKPFATGEEYVAPASTIFPAGKPTGVTVELNVPAPGPGIQSALIRKATVPMPEGIALSAGVGGKAGDGLDACSDEQFGLTSSKVPTCPAKSKVGTVSFDSPLVGVLKGDVFVGESTPDALLREFVYVSSGDIQIKLLGKSVPDPKTGQVVTVFDNLPPQPFTSFKLNFRGGATAVLKAPDVCGKKSATGALETFTGPTTATPTGIASVTSEIETDGCAPEPKPFAPTLAVENGSNVAGANTTLRTIISRTDADQLLKGTNVSLPPGALGRLASVPQCSVAQVKADAEKCPLDSLIGSVGVEAGTGDGTTELKGGRVYLTEGIDGSVAGLGIVVNAKVGPVDLGKSVIIGKMNARADLGIDLEVAETPTIVNGVPLYLRKMDILINKPGFLFNASSCAPAQIKVRFTSQQGATASATAPYNLTDCGSLKFNPKMTAKLTGNAKTPGFVTQVRGTDGESTLRDTELTLPSGVSVASLATLQNTCLKADYDANNCKPASIVGDVRAETSLLPLPLTGPVTLITLPGNPLPALGVKLRGAISFDLIVLNRVENDARLTSVIAGVPDSPISNFQLNLKPDSLLGGAATLCSTPQTANGKFIAYSGAISNQSVPVDTSEVCGSVTGAAVRARATLKGMRKGKKPALRISLAATNSRLNARITSAKVTLPSKLRAVRRELGGNARAVLAGAAAKDLKLSGRSLSVKAAKNGDKSVVMTIDNGALRNAGIKVGQRVTFRVSYTQAGSSRVRTINVSTRAAR